LDGAFTARRIAGVLESPSGTYPAGVVQIKEGANGRPLFCLLGAGATVLEFRSLAATLRTRRPMLAFELHNLQVDPSVFDSIENTAAAVIERMREIQPVGPYAIIGYSYGGNLAVEVSRQLIAGDQSIELAVVLDAYAPGALLNTAIPRPIEAQTQRLKRHFEILIRANLRQAWAYISLRRRISKTCKRCMSAVANYRAAVFPGRITLVRADTRDDWIEVVDSSGTSGWGSICEGGVDVIPIACHHLDILKEPHVTDLAQYIDRMLIAIDRP
jgi:thioesterase domain-containing protein